MKGIVALQLNDDDSILIQATVPLDADRAKVFHFAFDFDDLGAALAKAGEQVVTIKDAYVAPKTKSNITTLS